MKSKKSSVYNLALAAIFAALTAAAAQIFLPFFDIPFTASIIPVMLCGLLLTPAYALLSMLCYIALGAAGLPVFAGLAGGAATLLLPTGGFIASYPFMALLISVLSSKTNLPRSIICILSLPICYFLGATWFAFSTEASLESALKLAVLPFVPLDVIKCFLAAYCGKILKKSLKL